MINLGFVHGLVFGLKVGDIIVEDEDNTVPPEFRTLITFSFAFLELNIIF